MEAFTLVLQPFSLAGQSACLAVTFLELYSHCKKGNVEMVETMIDGDGVDVDLRYTVRLLRRAVGCAAAPD